MKKTIIICSVIVLFTVMLVFLGKSSEIPENTESDILYNSDKVNVYLFRQTGCSHCEELITYMRSLSSEYRNKINIYYFNIYDDGSEENKANKDLMIGFNDILGDNNNGTPYMIIGDESFIGYNSLTMNGDIKDAITEGYINRDSFDIYSEYVKLLEKE